MSNRRRYDTTALIADLKSDRRRGVGLSVAAILIMLALVGFYFSQIGSEAVPVAPEGAEPTAQENPQQPEGQDPAAAPDAGADADETAENAAEKADAGEGEEDGTAAAPEAAKAKVEILLPKKMPLWVDDESVGRTTSHSVELEPGQHTFKAKFGRKTVTHSDTFEAGTKAQVIFRRKKAVTKLIED